MKGAGAAAPWAAALVLVTALGPAAAADRLCPQGPNSAAPVAAPVAGCAAAVCTAVGEQSLCTCKVSGGWRFERRRNGQTLQHWRTEVPPMTSPGDFTVSSFDIDGDGSPEWLVARLQGVSNGLGVSYHTVCVVWPEQTGRAPLCRDVREWGALTVLVQADGHPGCSLMDSDWKSGREAGRGEGTYAVGRLLHLQGQRWSGAPVSRRSAVARRLLKDFEAERENLPQLNAQRLWYQHPGAATVPCPGPVCGSR